MLDRCGGSRGLFPGLDGLFGGSCQPSCLICLVVWALVSNELDEEIGTHSNVFI